MSKLVVIMVVVLFQTATFAQVRIWEGTSCKSKAEVTAYLAEGKNNMAVIVCPGGSYYWLDRDTEGKLVGEWLQRNGVSAFVLRYRTAGVFAFLTAYRWMARGRQYPDAQDDLRQTIKYIKTHSEEYGISPGRIGAMGFSAGGHLVMSAGELFDTEEKPAFISSIYPVVTMSDGCVHKRSRRALLGDKRRVNISMRDSLSLERHVPADCPPVFLVNCKDDPVVKYRNSELLDSALTARGVPHKYIQYQTGGHGFGASDEKGTEECRAWREEFLDWLTTLDLE